MGEERRYRTRKKKRTGLKVTLFILLAVLVAGGVYLFNVYRHVNNATEEIYKPVSEGEVDSIRGSAVTLSSKEPISILLLGVDSGDLGRTEQGRSDSMMVATINPNTKKTTLMSIPRDTYTEIIGYGTWDKINHAYAFGGTGMSINTVQNLLNIPIDYYVTVNMAGIQEIVDAVDGINVVSPLTFNFGGYQFYEGETTHLDGQAALAFARMRYEDQEGDTGRQGRQRLVIEGVIDKVISASTLLNYQDILNSLSNNVQTNFQMKDYLALQGNDYLAALRNIESVAIDDSKGYGGIADDGIWYFNIYDESLAEIQSMLRTELELD